MPVVHVILKKPGRDISLHAVDLLTDPAYGRAEWIFTRIEGSMMVPAWNPAPQSTSISGQTDLAYHHIDAGHSAFLKKYGVPANDVSTKLLAGI